MTSWFPLSFVLRRPRLSVVVIAYEMTRELRRTIYSLSPKYQRNVSAEDYEVIVVDNGSAAPPDPKEWIRRRGWSVRLFCRTPGDVSPCKAVNQGVAASRAQHVCVMVDGARMVSPGLINGFLSCLRLNPNAFVMTLAWHLGPYPQNISIAHGYDQATEDLILRNARWRKDGYQLFSISSLALSSAGGWFKPITESNCFALRRQKFQELGGFDERFVSPGGGLVNHDFFSKAVTSPGMCACVLLGEGSFHQIHGGVATNVTMADHPRAKFALEYEQIKGAPYEAPQYEPLYFGSVLGPAKRWIDLSNSP